jgi:8-oxo-dGTP pyrophosphatase MutT (NUDIX family)
VLPDINNEMITNRTVKAVLIDKDGCMLLLRRSKSHPTQSLQMDMPGGYIDGDEQPLDTLLREIKEETGNDLSSSAFKLVYATTQQFDDENRVRLVYVCKLGNSRPAIKLSWEHDNFKWLETGEALKLLDPTKYKYLALDYIIKNNIIDDL